MLKTLSLTCMMLKAVPFVYLLFLTPLVRAQELLKVRPSPLAIASARYQDSYVKITYSQPQRKDREIFGGLVPYGQVWRTGANEATEITTTKNITIGQLLLKAGTYSLFTIPQKEKWTIIINSDQGLWGAYNYNPKKDVYRFEVPVQSADKIYDVFTILLDQRNEVADLLIMWDNVKIAIPIKFLN